MKARADSVGAFWEEYPEPSRVGGARGPRAVRQVAPPFTGWVPARELPNLSNVKLLGLDTETKDLELLERGPGFVRKAAHIVGVSVAVDDAAWYFPLRHEYAPQVSSNMDAGRVLLWLQDVLRTTQSIVGANLMYDLEALRAEGVTVPRACKLYDVLYAEPLLDEHQRLYNLEVVAQTHLGVGKDTPLLYQWCADSFGGEANSKQRANIWRAPPSLVGPYAESDALLPVQVLKAQWKALENENLLKLYKMECNLIPLLLDMRFRGVRIDEARATQAATWLRAEAKKAQEKIPGVDVWSAKSIERAFAKENYELVYTEAGNASFPRAWLEAQEHPLAKSILDVRLYEKAANPFVESYLLGNLHQGRVHCQFHPLRSDDYGTVSGRFSSSNPNLQNIPARHPVLGPYLRSLYIPEDGCDWQRGDHSQIEYRLLVHDAVGEGSDELRRRYTKEPETNFHKMTQALVREITGVTLEYKPAKNFNFGLVYGMGKEKITRSLGVSADLAARLYEAYFKALPSVKATNQSAQRLASRRGYIKTLMGRRRRFPNMEDGKYGQQRAGTHAALNARLQGGAADVMKKGMLDCYTAGVFEPDACGIPSLTVHDELDWSRQRTAKATEAFKEAKHILETCVKLRVPLIMEMSTGANWGDCK